MGVCEEMKTKGLTLKEAVDSGRKFRRSGSVYSYHNVEWLFIHGLSPRGPGNYLSEEDALATDYELEPEAPRTKKRWKYLVIYGNPKPSETNVYYKDDEEFLDHNPGCKWFERIEESGREFPVIE